MSDDLYWNKKTFKRGMQRCTRLVLASGVPLDRAIGAGADEVRFASAEELVSPLHVLKRYQKACSRFRRPRFLSALEASRPRAV